jgi:hypothetical protein
MTTIIRMILGFGLALTGAVIIQGAVLNKKTDVYSFAYCAPQAITSPVFILNVVYFSEELYQKKRIELERNKREIDPSEILGSTMLQGALISAIVTGLFWAPFFFHRITKRNPSPNDPEQ